MKSSPRLLLVIFIGALVATIAAACERYEPPPTPVIEGLSAGLLYDSKAPLVIDFGQPIDPATLKMKVAAYTPNLEGDLPDEDDDPDTELKVILAHDTLDGDRGGSAELVADNSKLVFTPSSALPVGPKLVLLVEGGLTGTGGRVRVNRTRILFSYAVRCNAGARSTQLQTGVYFVLLEVDQPLGTQIQLYGALDVDADTGAFIGQFTNADRSRDGSRCPTPCGEADACRLLPTPACVAPSLKAGTVDEHTDFVPNFEPPTGYSFRVEGCAVDESNGAGVVSAPADMVVQSPPVTVAGLTMTAFFGPDESGTIRGTGSLTADTIYLGGNVLGNSGGRGSMTAIRIPDDLVPSNVPRPAKGASDGGVSDASR
ncbi:MAG: hypothetical protein KF819_00945 [Labilithrix sp.]|nr:hypothetical protein [Labilithrix sp.]